MEDQDTEDAKQALKRLCKNDKVKGMAAAYEVLGLDKTLKTAFGFGMEKFRPEVYLTDLHQKSTLADPQAANCKIFADFLPIKNS